MRGWAHLRSFVPGQHSSEDTLEQWRTVGDTESDLRYPGIKPLTSRTNSAVSTTEVKTGKQNLLFEDNCLKSCDMTSSNNNGTG